MCLCVRPAKAKKEGGGGGGGLTKEKGLQDPKDHGRKILCDEFAAFLVQ